MKTFAIVLLVVDGEFIISEAQRQFATTAQGYILSANSFPHITIGHFEAPQEQALAVGHRVKKSAEVPQPKLVGISLYKRLYNLWGVSLIVERSHELVALSKLVTEELKKDQLKNKTPSGELYRPHLTLARITEPRIDSFDERILRDSEVVLALGVIDEYGQLVEVLENK